MIEYLAHHTQASRIDNFKHRVLACYSPDAKQYLGSQNRFWKDLGKIPYSEPSEAGTYTITTWNSSFVYVGSGTGTSRYFCDIGTDGVQRRNLDYQTVALRGYEKVKREREAGNTLFIYFIIAEADHDLRIAHLPARESGHHAWGLASFGPYL